jgi:hypothetical protein
MPLAHNSVLAEKMKAPQLLDGISYNPVASSFPSGPPTCTILPGSTYGIDTGLNTLKFKQQIALKSQLQSRRGRRRKRRRGSKLHEETSTFGVVGHQEDSHLDRLEKKERNRPGPASYKVPPLHSTGGKFNLSNAKSDVDWMCYHAAQQPGPGAYTLPPWKVHGGKFSNAFPKSDVDWLIYYAARRPGVGEYDLDQAFHRHVGPGPEARMASTNRGLYDKKSTYKPLKLPRKIVKKEIIVTKNIHQKRKNRRSFARFPPGDERRQKLDRHHSNKTLGKSLQQIRGKLSAMALTSGTSSRSNSQATLNVSSTSAGSSSREESLFKHVNASELIAPPKWDSTASVDHSETTKRRPNHFSVPEQRQGGAGACWASSSAGLIFVAHNESQYKLDKSAHRNHDVRSVVRVAPLRVPRF